MARILVIDDDEPFRSIIAEVLENEGHQVDTADEGGAGVTLAAQNHPDLILCDVVMCGLDGYGVLGALRQDPQTATIPIVFVTGMSAPAALRRGMNLGADDYIVKPISRDNLLAAVRARLARSAAIREEAQQRVEELRNNLTRSLLPHELLTPLTVVMGLSSLLMEEGAIEASDVKEVARGIFLGGQRLEEMITKFLVYAELEAATPGAGPALTAERTLKIVADAARAKGQRVEREADIEIRSEGFETPLSSDQLKALVDELVENALKFSTAGSKVLVHAWGEAGASVLSVTDHGQGMTPEHLSGLRHHAPFLRRHQEQPGLGLGLSIVRRLSNLYGGDLAFDTVTGSGTTVRVRIPYLVPALRPAAEA